MEIQDLICLTIHFKPLYVWSKSKLNLFDWNKSKIEQQALSIPGNDCYYRKRNFVLNTGMQLQEMENEIKKIEEVITTDSEIISLREYVVNHLIYTKKME
jgi:hypothetical protein